MRDLAIVVVLLAMTVTSSAAEGTPPPCSDASYRQFDFWLGEWTVTTPDGKLAGTNSITAVYGGCALREEWSGAGGSGGSFNMFDRNTGRWHQSWVDNSGGLLLLDGELKDRKMQLRGTSRTEDRETIDRITWSPLAGGKVRQYWEQSTDGGKSWSVIFDGTYTKKK
jgi:hypothetical protein